MKRLHGFWLALAVLIGLSGSPAKSALAQDKQSPAEAVVVKIDPRPVILTAVTVPARLALCGWNSWLAAIFMSYSAGMPYGDVAHVMESGYAGSWVVTPEMINQAGPPPAAQKRAIWEIDNLR